MQLPIYVSTGGVSDRPGVDVGRELMDTSQWGVELSGGAFDREVGVHCHDLAQQVPVLLHNYFPPPKEPILLNLSSASSEIRKKTIGHFKEALRMSAEAGAHIFAVHAGFLVDVPVRELGSTISRQPLMNRSEGLKRMSDSLSLLIPTADQYGVELLVENHALSLANHQTFGENFLLLVEPEEIQAFLRTMEGKVGLLLDAGHLKTAATTLQFDVVPAFQHLSRLARAYHLSDNDGRKDAHAAITDDSWFLPYLELNKAAYTVEIHGSDTREWLQSAEVVAAWLTRHRAGLSPSSEERE